MWDVARKKKRKSACEAGPETTTKELAATFGVGVRAVDGWTRRGLPFVKRHGRRFFDIQDVRKWLAATGLLPGARGVPGGKARARQRQAQPGTKAKKKDRAQSPDQSTPRIQPPARGGKTSAGDVLSTPGEADRPVKTGRQKGGNGADLSPGNMAATGLEAALGRVETVEREMGTRIIKALEPRGAPDPFGLLGDLKKYKDILGELRLATKGFIEVQRMQGELVPREDLLDKMARLAALIRGALERFADEIAGRMVTRLGEDGIEVGDMAAFQRAVHAEAQRATDEWLRQLSDRVRQQGNDRIQGTGDSNGKNGREQGTGNGTNGGGANG